MVNYSEQIEEYLVTVSDTLTSYVYKNIKSKTKFHFYRKNLTIQKMVWRRLEKVSS